MPSFVGFYYYENGSTEIFSGVLHETPTITLINANGNGLGENVASYEEDNAICGLTLNNPYLAIDMLTLTEDRTFKFNSDGTYEEVLPTFKVLIDLTTLSGWSSLSAGIHSITVKAKATGYRDSEASNIVTVTKTIKLTAPTLTLTGDIASWTSVPNASNYGLVVDNGSPTTVTGTSFDLSTLSLATGDHTVKIKANGDGYYTDSDYSNMVEYTVEPSSYSVTGTSLSDTSDPTYCVPYVFIDGVNAYNGTIQIGSTLSLPIVVTSGKSLSLIASLAPTVTNANYEYSVTDTLHATITIYNPIGPVSITINVQYSTMCCMDAGSKILMSDNSLKNIEDIVVGDHVLSYDEEEMLFIPQTVVDTIIHENSDDRVIIKLQDGKEVGMRAYHAILTDEGWKTLRPELLESESMDLLKLGDKVVTIDGTSELIEIIPVDDAPGITTYNLNVEDIDNYIANGIVVHNIC